VSVGPLPPPRARPQNGRVRGGVRIAAVRPQDTFPGMAAEIAALHTRAYAPYFTDVDHRFEAHRTQDVADFLDTADGLRDQLWLAHTDADGDVLRGGEPWPIVATAALDGREPGLPLVRWVVVDSAHRGRGLGRQLMQTVIDAARAHGAPGVRLTTHELLVEAQLLYDSLGFDTVGTIDEVVGGVLYRELVKELRFHTLPTPIPLPTAGAPTGTR
jgi:GNAT superfamily N-acetyltransferase